MSAPRSFWFTLVLTHQMAVSLFRFIGALARSQVVASSVGCGTALQPLHRFALRWHTS